MIENIKDLSKLCLVVAQDLEEYEKKVASLDAEIDRLYSNRDTLVISISTHQKSLLELQLAHEQEELGYRQRLADLELSITTAEAKLSEVRRMAAGLAEIVAVR